MGIQVMITITKIIRPQRLCYLLFGL